MPTKTWQDFPVFYNCPVIQRLANNPKWTVSDLNKRPIDMYEFIVNGTIIGAKYNEHNPLVTLQTLCDTIPNATNNAYLLDAAQDGIVVLDVEPKCPDEIKQLFMGLPYIYGETSMSGKGIHLIFELPKMIYARYPHIQTKLALKEEHGYYEILLNHMVTFTRNNIANATGATDISVFENVFELLAQQTSATIKVQSLNASMLSIDDIPGASTIVNVIATNRYYKSLHDFNNDNSKYEYNMAMFYYQRFDKMLGKDMKFKDHTFTMEELAVMIYECMKRNIAYRPKHDSERNGMPWLLYIASTFLAKNDAYQSSKLT